MPYLWDKTFTLKEVNEITFKNKPLKVAYRKGKTFFGKTGKRQNRSYLATWCKYVIQCMFSKHLVHVFYRKSIMLVS